MDLRSLEPTFRSNNTPPTCSMLRTCPPSLNIRGSRVRKTPRIVLRGQNTVCTSKDSVAIYASEGICYSFQYYLLVGQDIQAKQNEPFCVVIHFATLWLPK